MLNSKVNTVVRTPGDRQMRSPYPEFVLINIICIEKALKGTEIVFVLTRFYCIYLYIYIYFHTSRPGIPSNKSGKEAAGEGSTVGPDRLTSPSRGRGISPFILRTNNLRCHFRDVLFRHN